MSKWKEYLKLIPDGLLNFESVIEGVVNNVLLKYNHLPEDERSEIIRRRLICETCPFMSENAKLNSYAPYQSDRTDKHCIFCSCPISKRTAALSRNCGIESHNRNNPESPLELKWEVYKTKTDE